MIDGILHIIAAKSDRSDTTKWLPFTVHSRDTAGIIRKLFCKWLPESERNYIILNLFETGESEENEVKAADFCVLTALLHDIGKITPAFQSKITGSIEGHTDRLRAYGLDPCESADAKSSPHNTAGCAILESMGFPFEITILIDMHHGMASGDIDSQMECFPSNYYGKTNTKVWQRLWQEWIDRSMEYAHFSSIDELPRPDVKCQMLILGLLIMSDWIASNTEYFPLIDTTQNTLEEDEFKRRVDHAWEELDLPMYWSAGLLDFENRFGFDPNNVQLDVINIAQNVNTAGIYILEAPMGLGKTEAALAMAEIAAEKFGCGGIYFGLPTQATANGVFGRIHNWAEKQYDGEKHTIKLAHGMTELNEEYQSLFKGNGNSIDIENTDEKNVFVHDWFESGKKSLLADFVIATVDQFLLASLKQKHVMLRHLGLAGKVVIIDECHAYDAYMNVYLDKTLAWMGAYGVPVIILSATLPPERRNALAKAYLNRTKDLELDDDSFAYPALTWTDGEKLFRKALENDIPNKKIKIEDVEEEALSDILQERLSDGGCAAVIVNTVDHAVKLAKEFKEKLDGSRVVCFHSRFTATDRAENEKELLHIVGKDSKPEERNRLIVVGTQVIEQSLDLDFDFMITELCPMDLLLQRSGRLHRHKRQRPDKLQQPVLAVVRLTDERMKSVSLIYSKWLLDRTEKYLPDELNIPSCIPMLVEKVYETAKGDEIKSKEWEEYQQEIGNKKYGAEKYCINSPDEEMYLDEVVNRNVGNDAQAEASVRDSEDTPEVIFLQKKSETEYGFVSQKETKFDCTSALLQEEAEQIARERLRLPLCFGRRNFIKTVENLMPMPLRWRENKLLKGMQILLLDENAETTLLDRKLLYSREYGLETIKGEEV